MMQQTQITPAMLVRPHVSTPISTKYDWQTQTLEYVETHNTGTTLSMSTNTSSKTGEFWQDQDSDTDTDW